MVERRVNKRMVRFGIWMAVYCAVMLIDGYWLPKPVKMDFVHVVGALVPMIPLLFAMQANFGAIQSMDELDRRVCVEGMMFAIIGTIVVTLTVGFLQWMAAVPTISLGWVWPIIAVFYGIGAAFARRKYS
jgi:uncharacterized protein YacL